MTEQMKTVCVGRFLIDVPVHAQVSLSRDMLDGFSIETVEETEGAFRARVAEREREIAQHADRDPDAGAGGMVDARDLRVPDMLGRLLIFGRTRSYAIRQGQRVSDDWVSIEAHGHLHGLSFLLSMKYADEPDGQAAEALLARARPRRRDEIPAEPGFCIERAVFVDPLPVHKTEHIALHIGFPDHPDVALAFASMPGGAIDGDLLARHAEMDASAGADELLRVTRLRLGRRAINGVPGEEVLERVREFNFATTYGFLWEAQGIKDDPRWPFLSLELHGGISARPNGKPADTSLHEHAVLALWDRISSSIRPRPSGAPPVSADLPGPPGQQLGAVITAGEICPQSGWWACRERAPGVDVHGGAMQWIHQGERVPQALLLPRQTLWQTLRGIQPSIEPDRPTDWRLVDKRQRPRTQAKVVLVESGTADTAPGIGADVAVGTLARTGDVCPTSGWWRCDAAQALDGTRWFACGSVMPAATFQLSGRIFGRATGTGTIQRRSDWRLVRHADAKNVSTGDASPPSTGV